MLPTSPSSASSTPSSSSTPSTKSIHSPSTHSSTHGQRKLTERDILTLPPPLPPGAIPIGPITPAPADSTTTGSAEQAKAKKKSKSKRHSATPGGTPEAGNVPLSPTSSGGKSSSKHKSTKRPPPPDLTRQTTLSHLQKGVPPQLRRTPTVVQRVPSVTTSVAPSTNSTNTDPTAPPSADLTTPSVDALINTIGANFGISVSPITSSNSPPELFNDPYSEEFHELDIIYAAKAAAEWAYTLWLNRESNWEVNRTAELPATIYHESRRIIDPTAPPYGPASVLHHLTPEEKRQLIHGLHHDEQERKAEREALEKQRFEERQKAKAQRRAAREEAKKKEEARLAAVEAQRQAMEAAAAAPPPDSQPVNVVDDLSHLIFKDQITPASMQADILATLPIDASKCSCCQPTAPCYLLTLPTYTQSIPLHPTSLTSFRFNLLARNPTSHTIVVKLTSNVPQHIFIEPDSVFYVYANSTHSIDVDYIGDFQTQCERFNSSIGVLSPHYLTVSIKVLKRDDIANGFAAISPSLCYDFFKDDHPIHSYSFHIRWEKGDGTNNNVPEMTEATYLAMKEKLLTMVEVKPVVVEEVKPPPPPPVVVDPETSTRLANRRTLHRATTRRSSAIDEEEESERAVVPSHATDMLNQVEAEINRELNSDTKVATPRRAHLSSDLPSLPPTPPPTVETSEFGAQTSLSWLQPGQPIDVSLLPIRALEMAAEDAAYNTDDGDEEDAQELKNSQLRVVLHEWEELIKNAELRRQQESERIEVMQANSFSTGQMDNGDDGRSVFDGTPMSAQLYQSQKQYLTAELCALDQERDTLQLLELDVDKAARFHGRKLFDSIAQLQSVTSATSAPSNSTSTSLDSDEPNWFEVHHARLRDRAIRLESVRAQHRSVLSEELNRLKQSQKSRNKPTQFMATKTIRPISSNSNIKSQPLASLSPPRGVLSPIRPSFQTQPLFSPSELKRAAQLNSPTNTNKTRPNSSTSQYLDRLANIYGVKNDSPKNQRVNNHQTTMMKANTLLRHRSLGVLQPLTVQQPIRGNRGTTVIDLGTRMPFHPSQRSKSHSLLPLLSHSTKSVARSKSQEYQFMSNQQDEADLRVEDGPVDGGGVVEEEKEEDDFHQGPPSTLDSLIHDQDHTSSSASSITPDRTSLVSSLETTVRASDGLDEYLPDPEYEDDFQ